MCTSIRGNKIILVIDFEMSKVCSSSICYAFQSKKLLDPSSVFCLISFKRIVPFLFGTNTRKHSLVSLQIAPKTPCSGRSLPNWLFVWKNNFVTFHIFAYLKYLQESHFAPVLKFILDIWNLNWRHITRTTNVNCSFKAHHWEADSQCNAEL